MIWPIRSASGTADLFQDRADQPVLALEQGINGHLRDVAFEGDPIDPDGEALGKEDAGGALQDFVLGGGFHGWVVGRATALADTPVDELADSHSIERRFGVELANYGDTPGGRVVETRTRKSPALVGRARSESVEVTALFHWSAGRAFPSA